MQDSASLQRRASTITLSRREREAERAVATFNKTHSHRAYQRMKDARTKALAAYARLRAPGGPASKPSGAQGALI